MEELNYLRQDKKILGKESFVTYVDFQVKDGTADMWLYDIFPGVQLMVVDFSSESCFRSGEKQNVIGINHCRKGRFECAFDSRNYLYMGEGDITLNSQMHPPIASSFPLNCFYGSTIIVFPEVIKDVPELQSFQISAEAITEKYSLESNKYLTFDEKFIYTTTPQKMFSDEVELKVTGEGDYEFKGGIFSIKKIEKVEKYPKDEDYEAIVNLPDKPLTIRTRRRGDFIQPFGMDGKMKLKKYLISKKIPEVLRDEIVLLCCESEVFWVSGVGLSDKLKVVKHPSHVLKYNKK